MEGEKGVTELLASDFAVTMICGTREFFDRHGKNIKQNVTETIEAEPSELQTLGTVETNDAALAVARMKPNTRPTIKAEEYALVLDDIRDPGNLGTIIRTADWFNVKHIIASEETADFYNPKVIRSTMGSFCRVKLYYTSIKDFISASKHMVYGTFLGGRDVHEMNFAPGGLIVIGNESNGISRDVEKLVTERVTIPRYGHAESLNASIAAAIILDNLRRS